MFLKDEPQFMFNRISNIGTMKTKTAKLIQGVNIFHLAMILFLLMYVLHC